MSSHVPALLTLLYGLIASAWALYAHKDQAEQHVHAIPAGDFAWLAASTLLVYALMRMVYGATGRARTEAALRRSEGRLRIALAAARLGTWEYDPASGLAQLDDAAARQLSVPAGTYPLEELLRRVHADDVDRVRDALFALLDPAADRGFVECRVPGEAGERWIALHGAAERDGDHARRRVVRIAGTLQDVSEHYEAEQALRNELAVREQLARTAEAVPGAVYSFRRLPDGQVRLPFASGKIARIFGVDPEELHDDASALFRNVHPDDLPAFAASIDASASALTPWHHVFRVRPPGQDETWLEAQSLPTREADGAVLWHGYLQDVTERRRTAHALRSSELRWKVALESAGDGLWDWDIAAGTVHFSSTWKRMLGYGDDDIDPSIDAWSSRVHPDDREQVTHALRGHFAGETEVYESEHRLLTAAGEWHWVLDRGSVVERAADGTPRRMIGTHKDLHARRTTEQALRESEARATQVLGLAPEAMLVIDGAGVVVQANARAGAMLGYASGTLVGVPAAALVPAEAGRTHPLHGDGLVPASGAALVDVPACVRRADGSVFAAEVGVAAVRFGAQRHLIATLADVTERHRAELALRRYAEIVNTSSDMLVFVDRALDIVVCNPAYARVLGRTPAQLAGRRLADVIGERLFTAVAPSLERALSGEKCTAIFDRLFPDGALRTLQGEYRPFRVEGEVEGVVVSMVDVTERVAADRALRESETKLRAMLNTPFLQVALLDIEGRLLDVNDATVAMTEMGDNGLLGLPVWDGPWFTHDAAMRERLRDAVARGARGEASRFESTTRAAGGELRRGESYVDPVRGPDGAVVRLILQSVDITERVEATAKLREREATLASAQAMAHVGSWAADVASGAFTYSEEARHILGLEGETLPADEFLGRVVEGDRKQVDACWDRALATGSAECEFRYRAGGVIKWLHEKVQVQFDAAGQPLRAIGMTQDVTEVREAQAALEAHRQHLEALVEARTAKLEEAEARTRLILESTADGLYGLDTGGRITFANAATCRLLGYAVHELVGQPAHALFHEDPAGVRNVDASCAILGCMSVGRPVRTSETFWRKDGRPLPVEIVAQPMWHGDTLAGAVVSFRDDTARREAEAARERALAEAERLARARASFVANMSHEIRTPLNAVLGYAQAGLREPDAWQSRDTLVRILASGRHLLGVVNDILDFSKIEAGKLVVDAVPFAPGEVVDRAVDLVAGAAADKRLAFTVDEAPDLPASCVGDPLRIAQVLANLLSNAVKFTPDGGDVRLRVRREAEALVFVVEDSGVGIAPDMLPRLFQSFEQADGSTTRRHGGTGLGLAITRELLDLMAGSIDVDTEPGRGSAFTVRVPLREAVDAGPAAGDRVALAGFAHDEAQALTEAGAAAGLALSAWAPDAPLPEATALLVVDAAWLRKAPARARVAEARRRGLAVAVAVGRDTGEGQDGLCADLPRLDRPLRLRHLLRALRGERGGTPTVERGLFRLAGLRILAVDDNAANRLLVEMLLAGEGAAVTSAEDGRMAMRAVRDRGPGHFDLVLTDIQMPEMDGYDAARRILEIDAALPVVGLTAHASPAEHAACLAAGMLDRLVKPIDVDPLVAAVLRHARRAPAPATTTFADGPPPAVDWDALASRHARRDGLLDRLLAAVLASHEATGRKLRAAAAAADGEAVAALAHALKGTAANLFAHPLRDLAALVEQQARCGAPGMRASACELAAAADSLLATLAARLRAGAHGES